jgi:coenzyme F420-reducing hydrogenase delta subunit
MSEQRIVVFTCNWGGQSGLEAAGRRRLALPAQVNPITVPCLGSLSAGVLLKAFELGAAGVLLLGCRSEQCRHDFGQRRAEEVCALTRDLLRLLGYAPDALRLASVPIGDGPAWVEQVRSFAAVVEARRAAATGVPKRESCLP